MLIFNLEVCEITSNTLIFNQALNYGSVGKYGVRQVGFKRIIEICETKEAAEDVIKSIYDSLTS